MILVFLGSMRATVAVFFSIPLSALATFMALSLGGGTVNSMVLGGLALALSRLIDNSVVVLENIYRHLELGEEPVDGRREWRTRSRSSRSRCNADDSRRLLSGDVSYTASASFCSPHWRSPLSWLCSPPMWSR